MAPKQTFGIDDVVKLFHGLVGMCVGWIWGNRFNVILGILFACLGCAAGCLIGLACSRLPRAFRVARDGEPRKHRIIAGLLAISGIAFELRSGGRFIAVFISDSG